MKKYKIEFRNSKNKLVFTDGGPGSTHHIYLEWTPDGNTLLAKKRRMVCSTRNGAGEVWSPSEDGTVMATFAKDIIRNVTLTETKSLMGSDCQAEEV